MCHDYIPLNIVNTCFQLYKIDIFNSNNQQYVLLKSCIYFVLI